MDTLTQQLPPSLRRDVEVMAQRAGMHPRRFVERVLERQARQFKARDARNNKGQA